MTSEHDRSRSDETRAKILRAATAAFADRGFHGTTTRDIALAAGMSPAALYVHHRSKEELLYLISRSGHERTLALVRSAIAAADGPVRQLAAVMGEFAADHARSHTRARIVNYELTALDPDHHTEILKLRHAISAEFRGLVQRGIDTAEFRAPDAGMTASALMSLGIDVARWYRPDGAWTPEYIGEHYAELALRIAGHSRSDGIG